MSTRGVIGHRINGRDCLHYNHQDSYPENLGLRVLALIRTDNTILSEPAEEDDGSEFVGDSVFCQYAYVMNHDEQCLEFYKGVNTNPDAPGRYTNVDSWTEPEEFGGTTYYGIRLVKCIPFQTIKDTPEDKLLALFKEEIL